MKTISFDDIGAVTATFTVKEGLKGGQVAGEAGPCDDGDAFCGVALEGRGGFAAVQVKGFVQVSAAGEVGLGWTKLSADGAGGVKADESGREYLVVDSDSTGKTAVLLL